MHTQPDKLQEKHQLTQSNNTSNHEIGPKTNYCNQSDSSDSDIDDNNTKHQDNTLPNNTEEPLSQEQENQNQDKVTKTMQATPVQHPLKKNAIVKYKTPTENKWNEAKLISRAGKATGMYKNAWNIISDGAHKVIDFDRDTTDWKIETTILPDSETKPSETLTMESEEIQFDSIFLTDLEMETQNAKSRELDS